MIIESETKRNLSTVETVMVARVRQLESENYAPSDQVSGLQELMNKSSLRQQLADVSHERDLLRAALLNSRTGYFRGKILSNESTLVPESKLIKLAAELANRRPLRPLQNLCERQKSISTAKLIEDVEMCGDTLAAIALDIRNCVDASRAHFALLQAEIAQPATEKVDEQESFESVFPMPGSVRRLVGGYASIEFNAWEAHEYLKLWKGWQALAKLNGGLS